MPPETAFIPLVLTAVISGLIGLFVAAKLVKTRPKTAWALLLLIPVAALGIHTALILRPPAPPSGPIEQAGILIESEQFDAAIALLAPLRQKEPENRDIALQLAAAHFARGLLHAERKEDAAALQDLRTAQTIAPPEAPYAADIERFIKIIEKK